MIKIRILVFVFSIILLWWLFVGNLNEIDFAKTKNDAEFYRTPISNVENSKDLEELKPIAIQQIEYLKKNREINSENAIFRNWLIIGLTIVNIVLFIFPKKLNTKWKQNISKS